MKQSLPVNWYATLRSRSGLVEWVRERMGELTPVEELLALVAPEPAFSGLEAPNDRVAGLAGMAAGVLARGAVTTDMTVLGERIRLHGGLGKIRDGRRPRGGCSGLSEISPAVSHLMTFGLQIVHNSSVSGHGQQMAKIDDLLDVDVLILQAVEDLGLRPDGYDALAVMLLFDRSYGFQQGDYGRPLDVVARWVLKHLQKGVAVVVVQMLRFWN